MYKIVTKDERYVIIVEEKSAVNEYYIFETQDLIVEDNMEKEASDFYNKMLKEDQKASIYMSVKWDGCANMDAKEDNVLIHFCEQSHIDSFYGMLSACYKDAEKRFDFNNMFN